MPAPTILDPSQHFFNIIYEGNGGGQRVGKFIPFTDNGTIAKSCIFNRPDNPMLAYTPSGTGTNRRKYTISVWFKPANADASDSNGRAIFFAGSYGNDDGIQLSNYSNATLRFWMNGTVAASLITTRTFEDTSKFYHLVVAVDTTQSTASNRVKIYIDGDQITNFSTSNYPSENYDGNWSTAVQHNVGAQTGNNRQFDGNLAEFNYVDGTALTPSTFGLTDTSTGRWIPKSLTGITYGTNGFRLQFANTAGQTIGDDTSGNTNDLTVTNLAATDIVNDSPTQNFNTFGSAFSGVTLSQGNLTVNSGTSGSYIQAVGQPSFGVSTGKWYWEVKVTTTAKALYGWKDDESAGGSQASQSGTSASGSLSTGSSGSFSAGSWFIDMDYGTEVNYTTVSTNDILMFAIDLDNGKGYCGKNGTFFNSANPANGTGSIGGCHRANGINKFYPCVNRLDTASVGEFNFGQRDFEYTPPTGFLALQQDNLPETGKGTPDFVWIKNRDNSGRGLQIYDSTRGPLKTIYSNGTNVESTNNDSLQKFLKGGFAAEDFTGFNEADESHVAWNWVANGGTTSANTDGSGATIASTIQANQTAGFSIVKTVGTGSAGTIAHGLGKAPEWIMGKNLDTSGNWVCYHKSLGADKVIYLNLSATEGSSSDYWGTTEPTSNVFGVKGGGVDLNTNTDNTIFYCWTSIAGYSKFGTYEGNANAEGPLINLGFKPAFLMIKNVDRDVDWIIIDNARDPFNIGNSSIVKPNASDAESEASNKGIFLLSNGFKIRQSSSNAFNASGQTHIYMAYADKPFLGDGTNPVTGA